MAVTIKYQSQLADHTISSYTQQWATAYGDLVQASHIEELYSFFGGTDTSNNQIVLAGFKSHYESEAVIIGGTLIGDDGKMASGNYIQSLEFGKSLIPNTDNTTKHLEQVQLRVDGLNIEGDFYNSVCSLSRAMRAESGNPYQDGVDQGIYNLLRGNADPLLEVLTAKGIDVNTPLKDMAIASQFEAMVSDMPMIDTVGVVESSDMLLAA
ncbi:TPA: hemophore [Yersinia enterocolitica]|uniref:heme acquisition protein HasA n=1 Tax=Yersinia enterocolitica TaxID=630 RepID=UPI0028B61F18|nr:hemophore [Yersinia enterocolitica]EKN4810015.1 hemophore [Yersinia enterocolitica]ELI8045301.1 hemophore [Yersinia enterocolitica]ELI8442688.1 hemophore [Yersinia enterocolitica]ELW8975276.1 hemophore [Yersinia enterocolitica]